MTKPNRTLNIISIVFAVDFFERACFFAMRVIAVPLLISLFKFTEEKAAITNGVISIFAYIFGAIGYISSIKFREKEILLISYIGIPLFYVVILFGIITKQSVVFSIGFMFVFGFGNIVQLCIISILQNLIPSIPKSKASISETIISNSYIVADIGIILAMTLAPHFSPLSVSWFCFYSSISLSVILFRKQKILEFNTITAKPTKTKPETIPKPTFNSSLAIPITSLLISPFYSVISQIWTSWFFQGELLEKKLPMGFKFTSSKLTISIPILYLICIDISNKIIRKHKHRISLFMGIGGSFISAAALIVFAIQYILENLQIQPHILFQFFPYILSIMGDCILMLSMLNFTYIYTQGINRIIGISFSYLKLASGSGLSAYLSYLTGGNIYTWTRDTAILCAPFIPIVVLYVKHIERKRLKVLGESHRYKPHTIPRNKIPPVVTGEGRFSKKNIIKGSITKRRKIGVGKFGQNVSRFGKLETIRGIYFEF